MKPTRILFTIALLSSFSMHAIRMNTARIGMMLSAVMSYASLQKCGVYLPEMSSEMYTALAGTYIATSTGSTYWWLRNKTPQGRIRLAEKELNKVIHNPLFEAAESEDEVLKRVRRAHANKDFPYIEATKQLHTLDAQVSTIKILLQKAQKNIKDHEVELLDRCANATEKTYNAGDKVSDVLMAIKDLPDYPKRLKYHNSMQTQGEQTKAQTQIARAQWISAFARVISALNPFKK